MDGIYDTECGHLLLIDPALALPSALYQCPVCFGECRIVVDTPTTDRVG